MIVLGAAIAVITLYIIPVDQIVSAISPPGLANAIQHIQNTRERLQLQFGSDSDIFQRIDSQLSSVQYRLVALQDRLAGL